VAQQLGEFGRHCVAAIEKAGYLGQIPRHPMGRGMEPDDRMQVQEASQPAVGALGGDGDGGRLTRAPVGVANLAVRLLEVAQEPVEVVLGLSVEDAVVVHLLLPEEVGPDELGEGDRPDAPPRRRRALDESRLPIRRGSRSLRFDASNHGSSHPS
jgi:hypothetical protein